jgi:hypothetical protein
VAGVQPALSPSAGDATSRRSYEELEVMKRLLDRAVHKAIQVLPGDPHVRLQPDGWAGSVGSKEAILLDRSTLALGDGLLANFTDHATGFAPFEGYPIKGGIIFTATLPLHHREVLKQPTGKAANALSDWERAAKELRGEKTDDKNAPAPKESDSLADVILKVMAENGHHLSQLGDNDALTVAVTLRTSGTCASCHGGLTGQGQSQEAAMLNAFPGSWQQQKQADTNKGQTRVNPEAPSHKSRLDRDRADATGQVFHEALGLWPKDTNRDAALIFQAAPDEVKNLALLADLKLKQQQVDEAVNNYKRALTLLQDTKKKSKDAYESLQHELTTVELLSRLAQTHRKSGDQAALAQVLDRMSSNAKEIEQKAELLRKEFGVEGQSARNEKSAEMQLPTKLIISAPKSLLMQFGTGKMTLEEFKKGVSVTYQAP